MSKAAIDLEKKLNESLFSDDFNEILENNIHKEKKQKEQPEEKVVKESDPLNEFLEEPAETGIEIKEEPKQTPKEQSSEKKAIAKEQPVKQQKQQVSEKKPAEPKEEKRKEPTLIKKADHLPKGKIISEAKAEKIKKNPEVFVLVHEVTKEIVKESNKANSLINDEHEKESITQNAARSQKASENTQLLDGDTCGRLKRLDTGEIIVLNKPVFKIGKSNKFADYVVRGNTAVSRRHAEIITRNDRCYVRDKNSTNGTFVDGIQLPPETEVELKSEQTLTVANVNFKFRK